MLQDIRKNAQGTGAKIIIGLIVISFAAFGIESILLGGGSDTVAEVNGQEITGQELSQASSLQMRRLISMMGENYNPELLDESRVRAQALESLVARKVALQAAEEMGLSVSESQIGAVVSAMEQFQSDGAFNPQLYKQVLSENGYTPQLFKRSLRGDMMWMQARYGLAESEFMTPAELALNAAILGEQRDFRYLTIPGAEALASQTISEEAIAQYYAANEALFLTEESVDVEYIALSPDDFVQPVAEQVIREAYETAVANYRAGTEHRVSHLLLKPNGEPDVAQRLQEIQQRLAAGESFAELAQAYSQDVGSARRGGDLGYSSGDAFPEEMEELVAGLEPGVVSEPLQTSAGTHLVVVTERRQVEAPTLEEMRAELEQSIQMDEARNELLLTVDTLRDLAFTAKDLEEPAAELGLEIATENGVRRSDGEGPFASPRVRDAAFSEEVLVAGHNSEVMELSENQFIVLHVKNHHLPEVQPLADVRAQIEAQLRTEAARREVAARARAIVEQLESGASIDSIAAEGGLEWQVELAASRQAFSAPAPVLRRAFQLPADDLPVWDFLVTDAGDAVVVELIQVEAGDLQILEPDEQEELGRNLSNQAGSLIDTEFQQGLRQSADVVVM